MKKFSAIITTVIILAFTIATVSGCYPYLRFHATDIEPRTAYAFNKKYGYIWDDAIILRSYNEYVDYGVDLNYDEQFFETSDLLVIGKVGCSSNAYKFAEIRADGDTLYPVIGEHQEQAVTNDIISYAFYAEIPSNKNYKLGKVVFADENKANYTNRALTAVNLHFENLLQAQSIEVNFNGSYVGSFTIDDPEQIQNVTDILLARTYKYFYSYVFGPSLYRITLKFGCENGEQVYLPTDCVHYLNGYFIPQHNDNLDETLLQIGLNNGNVKSI